MNPGSPLRHFSFPAYRPARNCRVPSKNPRFSHLPQDASLPQNFSHGQPRTLQGEAASMRLADLVFESASRVAVISGNKKEDVGTKKGDKRQTAVLLVSL